MDVLIYGAGVLGKQVHYLVSTHFKDRYSVLGFIDDDPAKKDGPVVGGLKVLGSLAEVCERNDCSFEDVRLVLAIGYDHMQNRQRAFRNAKALGYSFESLVHPRAHVEPSAALGEGVIVLAGAVVDQSVRICDINYIDIGVLIGEETIVGLNNYLAAGVTLGGSVRTGKHNFFGLNSTVVNDVTIGDNNFINAQTLIHKNLEDDQQVIELHEHRRIQRNA